MAYSKQEVISYVEGIPVKISEPFRPPKLVLLPVDFDLWCIPSGLLDEEYDFTLEKQVLAHAEALERAKKQAKEDADQGANASNPSPPNEDAQTSDPNPSNNILVSMHTGDILQPQPLSNDVHSQDDDTTQVKQRSFNPADFENDIASPFDYVELQTLNVLDELSTVFQGWKEKTDVSNKEPSANNPDANSKNASMDSDLARNILLFDKALGSNHEETPSVSSDVNVNADVINPVLTSDNASSFKYMNTCPNSAGFLGSNGINFGGSYGLFPVAAKPSSASRGFSRLRSAKSASDISRMASATDAECPSWRPTTPPPSSLEFQEASDGPSVRFVKRKGSDSPAFECNSPSRSIAAPVDRLANAETSVKMVVPSLPDPYHDLAEEDQKFVDSLTDMGFPRSRVARAVKYSGTDEKKVVDYLCQVQSLEENGYDCNEAETALVLNDYRIEEARTFLNMMNQFCDLGFEREAVKRALVKHKNDRDKALDVLLSSSL